MASFRCLIVDDDPLARSLLEKMAGENPRLEVVATVASAREALDFLYRESIDILFLDVEMPEMSGLEMLQTLESPPHIIFVSGNPDYATAAFDVDADDFLLKPITRARFMKSISKVANRVRREQPGNSPDRFIYVKKEDAYVRVPVDDILYMEADSDYVTMHCKSGKFVMHASLASLSEQLPFPFIRRVHRSYLVNLNHVSSFGENMIEVNGHMIPVSKTGKKDLMNHLRVI